MIRPEDKKALFAGITAILIILVIGLIISSPVWQCPRWSYTNHCDALCYGKYGDSHMNHYHNESTVIPLDSNYDKYICICDGGNITTSWTCM